MISNILFTTSWICWTFLCAIIGFPLGLSQRYAIVLGKFWARGSLYIVKFILRIDCQNRIEIPDVGCLILAQHQSTWETIYLLANIKKPVFILKQELLKIPFYGWYLNNMGMISTNRNGGRQEAQIMNNKIIKSIQEGRQVIIFPHGTRVKYSTKNINAKLACLEILQEIKCKIYILLLNSGLYWPKSGGKTNGIISIKTIDDVDVNEFYTNKLDFKHKMRDTLQNTI